MRWPEIIWTSCFAIHSTIAASLLTPRPCPLHLSAMCWIPTIRSRPSALPNDEPTRVETLRFDADGDSGGRVPFWNQALGTPQVVLTINVQKDGRDRDQEGPED